MKLLYHFLIVMLFTALLYPQSNQKWGKSQVDYTIPDKSIKREYSFPAGSASEVISKSFITAYWFLISDVDGDNCPFTPSCSSFFLQSVKETNFLQGTLMFADRFTRDANFFNRSGKYTLDRSGKYYDPPYLYTLTGRNIMVIPTGARLPYHWNSLQSPQNE